MHGRNHVFIGINVVLFIRQLFSSLPPLLLGLSKTSGGFSESDGAINPGVATGQYMLFTFLGMEIFQGNNHRLLGFC